MYRLMSSFNAVADYYGNIGDFVRGQEYQIDISQDWRGRIYVRVCYGYQWKPYGHLPPIRFNSLQEFLSHWHNPRPEKIYFLAK